MALAWRAGATSTALTMTIPATVAAGDILLIAAAQWISGASVMGMTLASAGTTQPALVTGVTQSWQAYSGGTTNLLQLWQMTAIASDASKVLTLTQTGTGGYYTQACGAWSGSGGIDVAAGAHIASGSEAGTWTTPLPAVTTTQAGDWGVYIATDFNGGVMTTHPGASTRESAAAPSGSGTGTALIIADSGASVGGASTAIGTGTSWVSTSGGSPWAGFVVALAPPVPAPVAPPWPVPSQSVKRAACY